MPLRKGANPFQREGSFLLVCILADAIKMSKTTQERISYFLG